MNTAKIARLLHEIEEIITDSINMEQPVQWAEGVKALANIDDVLSEVMKNASVVETADKEE